MANLLDVVARLLGDTSDFDRKIEASTAKAEGSAGRIAGAWSVGGRALALGAAALFGIATKGVIELQEETATFRAETGATADEADRAGEAMLRMSARNIQPLGEIGGALTKVHTDLGLTGEEAERTTQLFLRFARATSQEASAAVVAFDDILDAWGLTAEDAGGLMDQLVASHQRYGGSLEGNQAALSALAPSLKAMNLTVDDGIGLLNLFAESGLDAGTAQRAMNTALQNLPPGENLLTVVERISAIEDPAKRAAAATEIFGVRAGAGLANALSPAFKGMDAYVIHADEVVGASEEAARVLDDTLGSRIQLALKGFSAAVVGAGKDIGPLLTGLGALGSLAGALGGGELLRKLGPTIVNAFKAVGEKAGDALSSGITAVVSGAQGTVIGNFFASRVEAILDPSKSTVIGNAYRGVAAKAALVYGAALGAGAWLVSAMVGVWNKLPLAGPLRAAILAGSITMGTMSGTATGTAAGIAFKLAFLAALVAFAPQLSQWASDQGRAMHDTLFQGPLEGIGGALAGAGQAWQQWRANAPWPIGQKDAPDWAMLGQQTTAGVAQIETPVTVAMRRIGASTGHVWRGPQETWKTDQAELSRTTGGFWTGIVDNVASARRRVSSEARLLGEGYKSPIVRAFAIAANRVDAELDSILQSIIDSRDPTKAASEAYANALKNPIDISDRIAALQKQIRKVKPQLTSEAPNVAAGAALYTKAMEDELFALEHDSAGYALRTGKTLPEAIAAQRENIARKANAAADAARRPLVQLRDQAPGYGRATGSGYSSALGEGLSAAEKAARNAAMNIRDLLRVASPARKGPFSEGGGPEGWGLRWGALWGGGLLTSLRSVGNAVPSALSPMRDLMGAGASATGTMRVELLHRVEGQLPAGMSAQEVAGWLQEGVDASGLLYHFRHQAGLQRT